MKAQMEVVNVEDIEKYEDMGLSVEKMPANISDIYFKETSVKYFYKVEKEDKDYIILGFGDYELPVIYDSEIYKKLTQLW
jgi:hypothetical protein